MTTGSTRDKHFIKGKQTIKKRSVSKVKKRRKAPETDRDELRSETYPEPEEQYGTPSGPTQAQPYPAHYPTDDYYTRPRPASHFHARPRARPEPRRGPREYYDDYYDEGYYDYYSAPPPRARARPPPRPRPIQPPPLTPMARRRAPPPSSRAADKPSEGGGSRKIAAVVVIICILILLFAFREPILDFIQNPPPLRYREYPEELEFTVSKSMTLSADPGAGDGHISYKVKSACPKDEFVGTDFKLQDVKSVKLNPEPSTGPPNIDSTRQEIMLWEDDNFQGTTTIRVTYTIKTRYYHWALTEEQSGAVADLPTDLKNQFNHDEWRIDFDNDNVLDTKNEDRNNNNFLDFGEDLNGDNNLDFDEDLDNDGEWDYLIEVSNPGIQSLASRLGNGETNVFNIVRNIFEHIIKPENFNYLTLDSGLPKACTTTLTEKEGDCDDYSILFITLCRALDIPAWLELGVLYDKQTSTWGGHAWARVAIPLKSGGFAAPAIDIVNSYEVKDFENVLFHDPYRFIEWADTGGRSLYPGETEERNNLDYYYHTFSYQAMGTPLPKVTAPKTNEFTTLSMQQYGENVKVPLKDDGLLGNFCMLPGFEISGLLAAVFSISLITFIDNHYRWRKKLR